MSVEMYLSAGIAALVSVVVALFTLYRQGNAGIERRLNECENDRKELWRRLIQLETIASLPATVVGALPAPPAPPHMRT